jgi:DNA-binding transcriptional ArsR family regulator
MFENRCVADILIGRSSIRQRILALLVSDPTIRLHLREIQRRAGTSPGTASRELAKLVAAGVIEREAEGAQVYFRAASSPLAALMRSLLILAPAPAQGIPQPRRVPRAKSNAQTGERTSSTIESPTEPATKSDSSSAERATAAATAEPTQPRVFRPTDPGAVRSAWSIVPDLRADPPARQVHIADPVGIQIARPLAESLDSLYAESGRLRGIYLYGARAAGPARDDADVETLIVLDRVDHYGADLERTSHLYSALSHELKLVVSRVFVSESDWLNGTNSSLAAVRTEAVEI